MNRRRTILGLTLFVLAAVILLLINRHSLFFTEQAVSKGGGGDNSATPYIDVYDRESGAKIGRLTAQTRATLEDGSLDWGGVAVELLGTDFGDATLTCKRAVMKLDQIGERMAGRVVLSGDVVVKAVKDGKTTLSAMFDKCAYDIDPKEVEIEGPLEGFWGEGVTISGVNLKGNLRKSAARFTIEKDVTVLVSGDLQPSWAFDEERAEMNVTAGGPMDIDLAQSLLSFGGGVKVTRGKSEITCNELRLAYVAKGDPKTTGPRDWELKSVELNGAAKVSTPVLAADAEFILWDAESLRAQVKGMPGKITFARDTIVAPEIEARLSDKHVVESVTCLGAGTAEVASVKGIVAAPDAQATAEPLKVSWGQSATLDDKAGLVSLRGSAEARQGNYHAGAESIDVRFDKEAMDGAAGGFSRKITGFQAARAISAADGKYDLVADAVSYDAKSGAATIDGNPASVKMPEGEFSAKRMQYSTAAKTLKALQGGKIVMLAIPSKNSSADKENKPVTLTANRLEADFSGAAMSAKGEGAVRVESEDATLSCDTIEAKGVRFSVEATQPVLSTDSSIEVSGRGNVKFAQRSLTASGDSFEYDRTAGTVALEVDEGKEVEITIGDSVTVWGRNVRVLLDEKEGELVCEKPRIFMTSEDPLMGFLPGERTKSGSEGKIVKMHLKAGGKMLMTRKTRDTVQLSFDGGVEGIKSGSEAKFDDRLMATTLVFDGVLEPDKKDAKKADKLDVKVTGARASGGVYIKYVGDDGVLEGTGDSFQWDKATNRGELAGNPATAVYGKNPVTRGERIIFDYPGKKVIVKGDRGGSITVDR